MSVSYLSKQNPSAMQSPMDGELAIHHSVENEVMVVVTALIGVSDITTRIKPHKDPDPPAGGQDDSTSSILTLKRLFILRRC